MQISTDTRRLMTELAYVACMHGRTDQARQILQGLEAVSPGTREVRIGFGLAAMTDGKHEEAVDTLRPFAGSGDAYGAGFLVLALRLARSTAEADAVCRASAPPHDDPAAAALLAATF